MAQPSLPEEAAAFLREWIGDAWTVEPLPGDASVRRYFRVRLADGSSCMLAYYPREVRPQLQQFLEAYRAVADHGRVPEVLRHSESAVLQFDAGDRTLYDLLHEDRAEAVRLYRRAIEALVEFQRASAEGVNPPFTASFFLTELEMTRGFYVEKLMGETEAVSQALIPHFRRLAETLTRHPYALCHRDYHGQNIHILNDTLFIIDYQDLRMGPDTYDLASLLRDRGVARILGEATELELVDEYARLRGEESAALRSRYFTTLLQRSIKILGTFSRQPIERGRLHYLEFIPPTLESVERCLLALPEFAAMRDVFPLRFSIEAARDRVRGLFSGAT